MAANPPNFWRDAPQWVSRRAIQQRFNSARCWERVQSGELRVRYIRDRHPARPKAREPYCTRSQIVAYYERDGTPVALVHQYLRTDGTLGASGLPDPKRFFDGNVLLAHR
jgi:hypothetical protein